MTPRLLLKIAVATVLLLAVATWVGRTAGREAGEAALARLQLIWPHYHDLAEMDRAELVGFSMHCDLHRREASVEQVLSCLNESAADANPTLPKDMSLEEARDRFQALLQRAATK